MFEHPSKLKEEITAGTKFKERDEEVEEVYNSGRRIQYGG